MIMHVYIAVIYCNRLLTKKLTAMTWQKMCLVCSSRLLKNNSLKKKGTIPMGKSISAKVYACANTCALLNIVNEPEKKKNSKFLQELSVKVLITVNVMT